MGVEGEANVTSGHPARCCGSCDIRDLTNECLEEKRLHLPVLLSAYLPVFTEMMGIVLRVSMFKCFKNCVWCGG